MSCNIPVISTRPSILLNDCVHAIFRCEDDTLNYCWYKNVARRPLANNGDNTKVVSPCMESYIGVHAPCHSHAHVRTQECYIPSPRQHALFTDMRWRAPVINLS